MKNGGSDKFSNLRILHRDVHRLIHSTNNKTIGELKTRLNLSPEMLKTVNLYRKKCNLELIDTLD
ncbi:hypothetical protein [Paenibacillus larvae]|nr:hypothetical protein [Paenibacillus larvae]